MAEIPQIPQIPFDMGAPPAELPQGDSNLPDFGTLPEVTYRDPEDGMSSPIGEWRIQVELLEPEQKAKVLHWWPLIWNRPSPHFDGKIVLSLPALFMHIEGEEKAARKSRKTVVKQMDAEYAQRYKDWREQCRQRQEWIDRLNVEWRARIAARRQAIRLWDEHVEQARIEFQNARDYPAPMAPQKI